MSKPLWPALLVSLGTVLVGCSGGQGALPLAPPAPANVPANAPWPGGGAQLLYRGRLEQTNAGSRGKTIDLTERIETRTTKVKGRTAIDYRGVETQSGKGAPSTTFDAYVAEVPSTIRKGSDVVLLKVVASASDGTKQTITYGAGNGVFDQVPEVPQARWYDTATRTESIVSSLASLTDTYQADGAYDEVAVPAAGKQSSLQSYGDGSAVYQWPYDGASTNSTIAFSPPHRNVIDVVLTNAALHVVQALQFGVWYPSVPPVLASDSFQNAGTARIPSACNLPKRYGTSAVELIERTTRLDVVFGEYDAAQRTAYVENPYGLVCLDVHDDLKTYYDYSALAISNVLLSEAIDDEVLGLQQARIPKGASIAATGIALPLDTPISIRHAARRLKAERAIYFALAHVRAAR